MKNVMMLLLFQFLLLSTSILQAQWAQTDGPYSGNIISAAVSEKNILAGTVRGLYLSADNGSSWKKAGLENKAVTSIAVLGENIFALTELPDGPGGIYKTTDNGTTWELANRGLPTFINLLTASGSSIYAGTQQGIYVSDNNGTDWVQLNNRSPLANLSILSISVSESNIYLGTFEGVFLSTNSGADWIQVNNGLNFTSVYALAASRSNVFAGTEGGVFYSSDMGSNWTMVNHGLGNDVNITSLFMIENNILAGTGNGGVYISPDNGNNWTQIITSGATANCFTARGADTFVGTTIGMFFSNSSDGTWSQVNNGLNASIVYPLVVNGDIIYAGVQGGSFFVSNDNGKSWIQKNMNLADGYVSINSIVLNGDNIFAGTGSPDAGSPITGVYLSQDKGENWTKVKDGRVITLLSSGDNIFVSDNEGVFVSNNNGTDWKKLDVSQSNSQVSSFVSIGTYIFAATTNFSGVGEGIYLSTDNGTSWKQVNNGLNNLNVHSLAVSELNIFGPIIFAGTEGGGVYLSSDYGESWILANNGLTDTTFYSLTAVGSSIFAISAGGGVYLSQNNGTDWRSISKGLPSNCNVLSLAVSQGEILAGTFGEGVWKQSLFEVTGISKEKVLPTEFSLSQNYPNPFNPSTIIKYTVPSESNVDITFYNSLGQAVREVNEGSKEPGTYEVNFNSSGLASGVYFYSIKAVSSDGKNNFKAVKKMILMK